MLTGAPGGGSTESGPEVRPYIGPMFDHGGRWRGDGSLKYRGLGIVWSYEEAQPKSLEDVPTIRVST